MKNGDSKITTQHLLRSAPFKIADVTVNISQNSLQRDGKTYTLQPKVLELLVLLCEAQGETVSKDALIAALWPDTVVGPDSLANSMARLRKALGDDAKAPRFIQTVQRKGYRWLQPVEPINSSERRFHPRFLAMSIAASVLVCATAIMFIFDEQPAPEGFMFPDLAIKKLPDGGYEIEAGIEGELTEEKKAAMLKELKRITGEEFSGMEFSIDPLKPNCEEGEKHELQDERLVCVDAHNNKN